MDKIRKSRFLREAMQLTGVALALMVAAGLLVAWRDNDADYQAKVKDLGVNDVNIAAYQDSSSSAISVAGVSSWNKIARSAVGGTTGGVSAQLRHLGTTTTAQQAITGWVMNVGKSEVNITFPVPSDMDLTYGILAAVNWTSTTNAAIGSLRWKLTFNAIGAGSGSLANGNAGQDSITTSRDSTAARWRWNQTKWDSLAGGYATVNTWRDKVVTVTARLDSAGGYGDNTRTGNDTIYFMGLRLAYVPKLSVGAGYRFKTLNVGGPTVLGQVKGNVITKP